MSSFSLSSVSRVHFIGIGGIGMSALARAYLHEGAMVSGSDRAASAITDALEAEGVTFFPIQVAANISSDITCVIYTEAMSPDHEEMIAARALGVPMMNYFEALGELVNPYYLIAVAGSHGKTTTTAMLIDIFEDAGLDPTAIVGSLRAKTKSNFRAGKSKYAIVEACEFKRDFLHLEPDVLVITNIDYEHTDYYKDLADVQSAFRELAEKVPADGFVVANLTDPNVIPVLSGLACRVVDYRTFFDPLMELLVPGIHNRQNAAAALAAANSVGLMQESVKNTLSTFAGTWRRFEYKGEVNGSPVYDDYAHHPTEIKATIAGARELYPGKKIMVVFQPHTYSRTHELFADFVESLKKADEVFLLPIYAAREVNESGVLSEQLVEAVGECAVYVADLEVAASAARGRVGQDAVMIAMGAGSVSKVAEMVVQSTA